MVHFWQVLPVIPKPVLLHCDRGYTIAFVTLLYLANQTRHDPASTPKITSTDFYNITAAMGLNFVSRIPQEVVSEITGEPVYHDPPQYVVGYVVMSVLHLLMY